jgi:hypothetical protein
MFLVFLVGILLWGACFSAQNCYLATTGSDNNNCTAQFPCSTISHCLAQYQGDLTISLSAGVYTGANYCNTNVGPATNAAISNLVIQGLPNNSVTIDCQQVNYHFNFASINATFTISWVTLANGNTGANGGCVYASAIAGLTVQNVVFTGCYATLNGGALYTDSPTSVSNSTFTLNKAGNSGGAASITTTASNNVSMSNCDIFNNTAYSGAALYVTGPYLQFTNGNITYNTATYYGGGVYLSVAAGQENFVGIYNVLNSVVANNTAQLGGGLYNQNINHTWNFYGALLSSNHITSVISNLSDPNIYCENLNSSFCYSCKAQDCSSGCAAGTNQTCSQTAAASQVFCYSSKFDLCSATASCSCPASSSGLPKAAKIMIVFIAICMIIGIVLIVIDVIRHVQKRKQGYAPIS